MRFRQGRGLTALALILGVAAAPAAIGARPQPVPGGEQMVAPAWTPVGVGNSMVNVVLQLAGDPVAVRQAGVGHKLSKTERDQIKQQLKGQQNRLRGSIAALGGTVLADYQAAYNGIKVRISRDKLAQLAQLPAVVGVRPLHVVRPDNVRGVQLIGAPSVWNGFGGSAFRGEGIKVAIIDTGVDYTHANFGGPGTPAAYTAEHAAETLPANPAWFGPAAPRVKGGIDLVGDNYDASADPSDPAEAPKLIPHPDPNPLDCNGHGSHVAGTAAGSGVTAAGATYAGPYNATTITGNSWTIGPGVAPKADIYAIRVFGCDGSTDVTVDAIEWAVDNDMDVINMSLGSAFGSKDDPSAEAATNAAKAGVIVVASAGNSGGNQYITGSPATGDGAISVAANDSTPSFPGATIQLPSGSPNPITAINANGFAFTTLSNYTIKVITDNPATATTDESLGCSVADFGGPLPANTIAVVNRGVCARVAKAIFGQQAGAAAVVMVNNAASLPPFEGPITSNPDDGTPFTVTIPFLGVAGPATTATSDGARLRTANGFVTTVNSVLIPNPAYLAFASFSSGGPRTGDSILKPDITAPGVSIQSTGVGTGNGLAIISGTSMASPHVAGVAALVRQVHPTWPVDDIKAAIVNTGDPAQVADYRTSRGGTGLVQPLKSSLSRVVASSSTDTLLPAVNFGFAELTSNFHATKKIQLRNKSGVAVRLSVSQANASGSPHTVSFNKSTVLLLPHGTADVDVTLDVPVATAGPSNEAGLSFHEVAGLVQFSPATPGQNANVTLRVPYYLVPRPLSHVTTAIGALNAASPSTTAVVTNPGGPIAGDADFYAWGLNDPNDGTVSNDVRAVGVQSFPFPSASAPTRRLMIFAVNTFKRWSNASVNEFDIYVDVDNDGKDDYIVVGVDQGAVQLGDFNGQMGAFVFSTRSPGASISFLASAPTDSSTALLPVLTTAFCRATEPCLSQAANPRITYHAVSFDLVGGAVDNVEGGAKAKFNVWNNAISTAGFVTVAPGGSDSSTTISVDAAEWANTPAKGLMVVTLDNQSGAPEAQLIGVTFP
jgi:subtilisin family serine protease